MARLSAKFSIPLAFPILAECRDGEIYAYSIHDGEYQIEVAFSFMGHGPKSGHVGSDLWKRLVNGVEIIATKEVGAIPEIPLNEMGGRDLYRVASFYDGIEDGYIKVAEKYYKRLIKFVKYELRQPFHDDEFIDRQHFSNPFWIDERGGEIGVISPIMFVERVPGMDGCTLGSKTFRLEHLDSERLQMDHVVELHQEILSDAQTALFSGDVRRAIFDLAIVCELSVKRKYFSEGGASGLAFDYFEDKGKVKVTVLELISGIAEEVLGESFKRYSPQDYSNIDYLIRCRNKVAHRGQVLFKDDAGILVRPDSVLVELWFASVEKLLSWLATK